MSCMLHPGDNVVLPSPTFLIYRPGIRMVQANSIDVALAAQDGFALPVDAMIEAAEINEARLVIVCAPNNPTGTIYRHRGSRPYRGRLSRPAVGGCCLQRV